MLFFIFLPFEGLAIEKKMYICIHNDIRVTHMRKTTTRSTSL